MNLEFIQKLADLVADKNLGEITVQNGDSTITVKGKKAAAQTVVESLPVAAAAAPLAAAPVAAAPAPEAKAAAPAGKFVKAPIVGTFYAASAPDQPPFVKEPVGHHLLRRASRGPGHRPGRTLCHLHVHPLPA